MIVLTNIAILKNKLDNFTLESKVLFSAKLV